jgi:hypothetical protein
MSGVLSDRFFITRELADEIIRRMGFSQLRNRQEILLPVDTQLLGPATGGWSEIEFVVFEPDEIDPSSWFLFQVPGFDNDAACAGPGQ